METKKIVYRETTNTINLYTGELMQQTEFSKAVIEREPAFIKMYVADLIRLKDLPKSTNDVLMSLLRSMSYKNIIPAYAPIKKLICSELGIKMVTLNTAIDKLYKAGILVRIERGIYMADPNLFGKGDWKNVKSLRMVIEYNENGTKKISGGKETLQQLELF